eukprot:CAMPEP_0177610144 /NCGR_PEP_ID=MMETSP0419_2-20121207/19587_1 /TAXON_ID=582737 /ORGANISM="Tetraselmis sp., Strain GSL018" /LENGTH=40 /DNA_ID= /DNA_START= /DNA_END= /DNA_ORIENTATION=
MAFPGRKAGPRDTSKTPQTDREGGSEGGEEGGFRHPTKEG